MYSSTLTLTSALDGVGWSTPRPGRSLPLGKTRYPLNRRLGGPQGRSGQVRSISPPPGFDSRTVQPVVPIPTELSRPTCFKYLVSLNAFTTVSCTEAGSM